MKISGHYYCGSCTLVFVEFCCSHACPFYKALFFLSNIELQDVVTLQDVYY